MYTKIVLFFIVYEYNICGILRYESSQSKINFLILS